MVTIKEIIARVDEVKPNAFSETKKVKWVAELDGLLAANVFLMSPEDILQISESHQAGAESGLLVGFPHDGIYDYWLMAKIDFANGEYEHYLNTMQMYNSAYADFTRWFARTYEPAQGYTAEEHRYVPDDETGDESDEETGDSETENENAV